MPAADAFRAADLRRSAIASTAVEPREDSARFDTSTSSRGVRAGVEHPAVAPARMLDSPGVAHGERRLAACSALDAEGRELAVGDEARASSARSR